MPVYHGNKEVEVKWVRYGGIESDETLDIMDFYMFAEWDSNRGTANGDLIPYVRDKVNEIKLEDIGMMLPSDSYIVIWDKYRNSIDFSEYLSRAKYVFTPTEEYSFLNIIVKGHGAITAETVEVVNNTLEEMNGKLIMDLHIIHL